MPVTLANMLILYTVLQSRSRSLYVVRPSVVCRQAIEIFGNVSTPFGTLAISDLSIQEAPLPRRAQRVRRA